MEHLQLHKNSKFDGQSSYSATTIIVIKNSIRRTTGCSL